MAEACTEPCIIVCDRGTMDISAYMTKDMWEDITRAVGTSTAELRERYDAVLHLVSAADGAEQFYTTSNNASRNEPADEKGLQIARMLDKKVISAWAGHSHLRVINNHEDFEAKIKRVLKEISNVLALPSQIEEERKYIVRLIGDIPECTTSEITQTYLVADPDSEVRLRKRVWNNGKPVYLLNSKKKVSEHEQIETEQQVNSNLYITMMQQADPYRRTIEKTRRSFIWKGQFFELDTYKVPEGLMILETKGVAANEEVKIPPFLEAVEDITGRKEYYNYNLANRYKPINI
jgi:CYTH domain-containing protein